MNSTSGYTGISFPFRMSIRGGVTLSTTNENDMTHIKESIRQILMTSIGERIMRPNFGSELNTVVFEPQDLSCKSLMAFLAKEALTRHEPRISITSVEVFDEGSTVYADVRYSVPKYDNRIYSERVRMGEVNNG